MSEFHIGRYRHYKGPEYVALGIARHSETEEEFVVYRLDYGDRSLWIRPLAMFTEQVVIAGKSQPRFEFIGPGSTGDNQSGVEPAEKQ